MFRRKPTLCFHHLIEIHECEPALLDNPQHISRAIAAVARQMGALEYRRMFSQYDEGVSAIALLGGAHILVHTWPNKGVAVVDVLDCGAFKTVAIAELMQQWLDGHRHSVLTVPRRLTREPATGNPPPACV